MKYKTLGKTGLTVSTVGYGALGLPGVSAETIRAAVDGGINYIDTARGYADSELKLGEALKHIGREKVIVSSKWMARELDGFKKGFCESLERIGTDYLDIMFTHDVSTADCWRRVRENGIVDYLYELKAAGRIRHTGCSTHDLKIGGEIIKSGLFEVVMLAYNAADPEIETTLIPLAKEHGLGIVIMKPLGGGVLTEKRSRELGFEVSAEEALRFVTSNPDVDSALVGLDRIEYVEEILRIWYEDRTVTEGERRRIVDKAAIKGRNYCRGCRYCLPCPKDIPIPELLRLYNRWEIFNQADWAHMHRITKEFSELTANAAPPADCAKCGVCTERCPYNLPIPDLMEKCEEMK